MTSVIFDVGGVLINWNPRYLYRTLLNGDDAAVERFLAEVCTPAWNAMQDAGRPFAVAVAELAQRFPEHADLIAAYDLRWEEMVPGAFEDTVEIVHDLKRRATPLYCLTNFSSEKFPAMRRRFAVFELFDGIVVSGEIGMIKPDAGIYRHLLDRFALAPGDCLFIDDVEANVAGAHRVGIPAVRFTSADALRVDLDARGLL